jgi:methylmalonyl-CoA mutase
MFLWAPMGHSRLGNAITGKHVIFDAMDSEKYSRFEQPQYDAWLEAVKKSVKNPEELSRLVWQTEEGFALNALYSDGSPEHRIETPPHPADRYVVQRVFLNKPKAARKQALEALNQGASELCIQADAFPTDKEWDTFLEDIHLDWLPVHYRFGESSSAALWFLYELFTRKGYAPEALQGSLHLDPISIAAAAGGFEHSAAEARKVYAATVSSANSLLPNFHLVHADSTLYAECGATASDELAFVLAAAVEYYHWLEDENIPLAEITAKTSFHLGTGSDFFLQVAKFRALPVLWKNVLDRWGLPWKMPSIHASVSHYNKTLFDGYTNVLRSSSECLAALIGGAERITVLPWNYLWAEPDTASQRLARNTALLLIEEGGVANVPDPGKGAPYIEACTEKMARSAWNLFLEIEAAGGLSEALKSGMVQQRCGLAHQKRKEAFDAKSRVAVGVNKYINSAERLTGSLKKLIHPPYRKASFDFVPMSPVRLSESLENERLKRENENA